MLAEVGDSSHTGARIGLLTSCTQQELQCPGYTQDLGRVHVLLSIEVELPVSTLCQLQVLGWEGFWGTVGMAIVGMPFAWIVPGSDIRELF